MLSARDLVCERGGRTVLQGVSLDLAAGEMLVLRGPNGAGKSTLLRLLATFLRPRGGTLCWDRREVGEDPEAYRAALRYVGHLDAVKPVLTAAENVGEWAALGGADDPEAAAMAGLEAMDIAALADLPARYLSAGQKKRVALARLLAGEARLWLLDEPTVSLDGDGVARLAACIARHRAAGGLVVAATHVDLGVGETRELRL